MRSEKLLKTHRKVAAQTDRPAISTTEPKRNELNQYLRHIIQILLLIRSNVRTAAMLLNQASARCVGRRTIYLNNHHIIKIETAQVKIIRFYLKSSAFNFVSFLSITLNKKGTFVYQKFLFCLSKPQAWHIIAARSAVYIISPFGAVYHHAPACIFPAT